MMSTGARCFAPWECLSAIDMGRFGRFSDQLGFLEDGFREAFAGPSLRIIRPSESKRTLERDKDGKAFKNRPGKAQAQVQRAQI